MIRAPGISLFDSFTSIIAKVNDRKRDKNAYVAHCVAILTPRDLVLSANRIPSHAKCHWAKKVSSAFSL